MFTRNVHKYCTDEALASEEMAHRLTWGRFVNWHGGKGRNIACNMAQEICNRVSKHIVKGMGLNKTHKAMERASKAVAGVQQIVKRMNEVCNVKRASQAHSHKSATEDEMMMVQDLRKIKPFETISQEENIPTLIRFKLHQQVDLT